MATIALEMSNSHSDFVSQTLSPSSIARLNKILPPGFKFDPVSLMKRVRKEVQRAGLEEAEAGRRGRKRARPWQKDKLRVKSISDLGERDWGLKVGGEPAKQCYEILQNLKRHALSGPFIQPVDPVALNLPDYLEIVKDPIDLSTVERNLKAGVYMNSQQFANDVRRIWLNAFTYNAHGSDMFYITLELATYFEKQFKDVENLIFTSDSPTPHLNRNKEALLEYMDRPMSLQEKRLLATNLRRLGREHAAAIGQIVFGNKKQQQLQHFQFNVEKLPPRTCRELEKFQMDVEMENATCDEKRGVVVGRVALQQLNLNASKATPNPQELPYYAEEIFAYLLQCESLHAPPSDYMTQQSDINYKMRAILVDWLVTVHLKFKLLPETLFQTVSLIDRYLAKREVTRQQLQLVGVTAMLLASKYEEIYPPEVKDFVHITDRAYTREQVLQMECELLSALEFTLTTPSSWRFLERFLIIAQTEELFQHFARYLLELSLVEYHMLKYRQSMTAAAVAYVAMKAQRREWVWSLSLVKASGYTDGQLKPCIKDILILFQSAPRNTLTGVREKFSRREFLEVSKLQLN